MVCSIFHLLAISIRKDSVSSLVAVVKFEVHHHVVNMMPTIAIPSGLTTICHYEHHFCNSLFVNVLSSNVSIFDIKYT